MVVLTTLYDEYIDRLKLTEQKTQLWIQFLPPQQSGGLEQRDWFWVASSKWYTYKSEDRIILAEFGSKLLQITMRVYLTELHV